MDLHRYLAVLRRHILIVVGAGVLGSLGAAGLTSMRTPQYEATAEILLFQESAAGQEAVSEAYVRDPNRYAEGQISMMTSRRGVALLAADALDVDVDVLLGAVRVSQAGENDLVYVTATATSPVEAERYANTLAETYVSERHERTVAGLRDAADELQGRLDALQARISELGTEVANQGDGAVGLIEADLQATIEQYKTLYARQQELLIEASLRTGGATIVQPAIAGSSPVGLGTIPSTVLGGLLGLVVGLGLAFVLDQFDDRLRTREEVEQVTHLPVLAEVPNDRKAGRTTRYVATLDEPQGGVAEASRTLRTSISFFGIGDDPVRRLLVTSSTAGEGKSLVSANLAVAYAQAGHRTVVVSADLRDPSVAATFGRQDQAKGLSNLFAFGVQGAPGSGRGTLAESLASLLVPTDVPNLVLLPSGPLPPNPAEILSSRRMGEILGLLDEQFDVVIVDTPPVLAVTDAVALAPAVGNVALVVGLAGTRRHQVERVLTTIGQSQSRVLGVVVNKSPVEQLRYGPSRRPAPPTAVRDERLVVKSVRPASADAAARRRSVARSTTA